MSTTDDEEKKKLEERNRLDAARLAEEKASQERIAASRKAAESERTLVAQRYEEAQEQHQRQTLSDIQERKNALDVKQERDKKLQETAGHATFVVPPHAPISEPEIGKPQKEPKWLQEFRKTLSKEENESIKHDPATGETQFSRNPSGLTALKKYLDNNPGAKFEGRGFTASELKQEFQNLKNTGILDKLGRIEVDGKTYAGDELKGLIQKTINWPPRPTPGG